MKKLLFYCFITYSFLSCDPVYWNEFVVVNNTNYDIRIEGFDFNNKLNGSATDSLLKPIETIEIKPQSSFSIQKIKGSSFERNNIFINDDISSVQIIFNNEKKTIQFCEINYLFDCDIERNILGFDTEYEKVKYDRFKGNDEYRYTYTITEEDYNNAVLIEN